MAELLRVKGELLLLEGAPEASVTPENHYQQGHNRAHRQGALSWELRCATSLARLRRDQAPSEEAHELLAPVYDRFTEGFATVDLRAARALLDKLHELIVSLDAEFDRHSKFRLIRTSVLIFLLVEGTRRRYRPSPNPIGSDGRGAKREREAQKMDLFRTLVAEGSRSLQTALLATKSLRFNLWGETIE